MPVLLLSRGVSEEKVVSNYISFLQSLKDQINDTIEMQIPNLPILQQTSN